MWGLEGARRAIDRVLKRWWRTNNRALDSERSRRWAKNNPEKAAARGRNYYEANRESAIEQSKKWQKDNAVARNAYNATRRKEYAKRMPGWVTRQQIKEAYLQRTAGQEMDHIYPLNSEWVSGFHDPRNLHVLSETENIRKFNKFCPALHLNQELPVQLNGYPAIRMLTLSLDHIRLVYNRTFYVGP